MLKAIFSEIIQMKRAKTIRHLRWLSISIKIWSTKLIGTAEELTEPVQLKYSVAEPGMFLATYLNGGQTAFAKADFEKSFLLIDE